MRNPVLTSAPWGLVTRNRYFRYAALGLASMILTGAATTSAQSTGEESWYQIEVIVFKRQQEAYQEHWPTNIKLEYPSRWVALEDPETLNNAIDPEDPLVDMRSATEEPASIDAVIQQEQEAETAAVDPLTTTPFLLLPAAEHSLTAHAAALRRNARYQVIFHQAWRQPLLPPRTASAVLINGGEQFDKHRELEGSITFSFSQFLQVKTNLWFTQFGLIEEHPTTAWPALPPIPQVTPPPVVAQASAEPAFSLDQENLARGYEEVEPWNQLTVTEDSVDRYQPARIVLLQEERRIRARELHYFDHPLFGVILQVTPYEAPAIAE